MGSNVIQIAFSMTILFSGFKWIGNKAYDLRQKGGQKGKEEDKVSKVDVDI